MFPGSCGGMVHRSKNVPLRSLPRRGSRTTSTHNTHTHTRHRTSFVDAFVGCRSISVPAFLSSRSYLAATIAIYKISPLFASFIPLAQGSNGGIWRAKPTLRLHLSSHGALVFGTVRPVLGCCSYRDAPIFDCTSRTNREWRCLGKNERVRRHKVDEQFRTGLVGWDGG